MRLVVFLLKCLVGFLASVGFLALLLVAGVAFLFTHFESHFEDWTGQEELPSRMVLMLDTADGLAEDASAPSLPISGLGRTPSLTSLTQSLERAAEDSAVEGLVVRLGYGNLSAAEAQELRSLVNDFQDSGKFAIGFAESFGEAGNGTLHYHLATAMDEIWLQPSGDLDLIGFQMETPFLAEVLEDWDVEVRFDQRLEYKGLADTLTRESMSPEVRSNLQQLLDSWFSQVAASIAEGRGLDEARAREAIDQGPYAAQEALEAGLVDRLGYWDELMGRFEGDSNGSESSAPPFVSIADYGSRQEEAGEDAPVIALVHVNGQIMLGNSEGGALSAAGAAADRISDAIAEAASDDDVAAILLRIDSPGGSYVASDTIWREVVKARESGVPVIASMSSVAASGGYFIAAPATRILALPGSITGSIGVAGGKLVLTGLWDRLGVNWDGAKAGENADIWSTNEDFDETQWERFQEGLDRVYADFTEKVARGRGLNQSQVEAAAGGRIWSGQDARDMGLVDELGGLRRAIEIARNEAGLSADQEVRLAPFPDPDEALLDWLRQTFAGRIESPEVLARLEKLVMLTERLAPLLDNLGPLSADRHRDLLQRDISEQP
ncbi:signal peptide peptidase SppA [Fodinicurvata halophila]|uniref:Signal peptide peptidase SppA n=1 Tax=Fodinicurvata halophila TaxID=1419723 RepID=A0ABV8UKQ1_9PROT